MVEQERQAVLDEQEDGWKVGRVVKAGVRGQTLSETEFVAFDMETTGLFPVVNRIVEFGAVRSTLDGHELSIWEQLVDPECLIPPEVTDIHGITNAMVRGKPTLAQALPGFLEFLGRTEAILLAYNAAFDLGFLNFAAAKTDLTLPANPVIDTLDLARTCVRGTSRHRLEDLVVHWGLAKSENTIGDWRRWVVLLPWLPYVVGRNLRCFVNL